jgi:hypothetical protein
MSIAAICSNAPVERCIDALLWPALHCGIGEDDDD